MTESQTNQEMEQQARLTQLEEQNEAIARDLAESIQREKEAAQDILDLSDKLLVANKNLAGYGKEKTATIFLKPGERPVIDLVGHWAARDWLSLQRQFLETVRKQPRIIVAQEPTEKDLDAIKKGGALAEAVAYLSSETSDPSGTNAEKDKALLESSVENEALTTRNTELEDRELVSVAVITRLTKELKETKLKLKNKSKRKTRK